GDASKRTDAGSEARAPLTSGGPDRGCAAQRLICAALGDVLDGSSVVLLAASRPSGYDPKEMGVREDLDRFYSLLDELAQSLGGPRRLSDCDGRMGWPERGVYFFFEGAERRGQPNEVQPRVVREEEVD